MSAIRILCRLFTLVQRWRHRVLWQVDAATAKRIEERT